MISRLLNDLQLTLAISDTQADPSWSRLTVSASKDTGSKASIAGSPLDTVLKINNARRRQELVCCSLEEDQEMTHIVLQARRYHGAFQLKTVFDGQWHPASPRNVWRIPPRPQQPPAQLASSPISPESA